MSTFTLTEQPKHKLPGDLAMWIFILAELAAFTLFILAFSITQLLKPEMFTLGRAQLDSSTGFAMTAGLLSSGFLAALAVERARKNKARQGSLLLIAAIASGMVYVVLKISEYSHLASLGFDLEYNTFFTLYWLTTAFHFLHVLLGLTVLSFLSWRCWKNVYNAQEHAGMESGVMYWHMVDLVWVIIFPLVYLLG
ncbi:cytochrome c oxidase subunit 3 family protein [Thiopseudomonas acetoxidans]|uniref:Cytochrome c oxidase subunit 3 family protein n=1 Tax=Thiopseudomonas acetoxidans TaxID=3041622 RepID=A0ABT7SN40_9GAMM|nr:cytochrome c oxidase subunit 3 family protein [Thiopseudomonas sp. CY1220]MDM7857595.1 cytochrome c oxidase subunit 3 family protein [Thiopseudomonas sp. CY1220]